MEFVDIFNTDLPAKILEEYCSRAKPGADKISYKSFSAQFPQEVLKIKERILSNKYKFTRFEVMLKAKKHYKLPRLIFKSSIKDRFVAKLMSEYLHQYYADFGYYPTKTRDSVLTMIHEAINEQLPTGGYKYNFFLRLDISNYFDSINRQLLLSQLKKDGLDDHFVYLVSKLFYTMDLSMDIPNGRGVPQGISVSSILADRYLKDLDEKYLAPYFYGHVCFIRYVDDILVFTSDEKTHKRVKKETLFSLQADYGLQINTDKISEGDLSKDSVDFLGTSINDHSLCISDAQIARVQRQLDDLFMWYRRVSKTRTDLLYAREDRALKSLIERLNLLITGYIYQYSDKSKKSRYGWIQSSLPRQIDNVDALKILDKYVSSLILTHIQDEDQQKIIAQNRKSFYVAFYKSKFTENEDGYILDCEKISQDEDAMYQITCNLSVVDLKYHLGDEYDKQQFEDAVGVSLYRHFCKTLFIANRNLTTGILYW